ncbi:hypothetical protein ACWX0K_20415 [Nitrobacteraceae bacterium UC4446_H13]
MMHRQIANREWLGKVAGNSATLDASLAAITLDMDDRENYDVTHDG